MRGVRMARVHHLVGAAACTLLGASASLGCPVCATEAGRRVREWLFGADFAANLAATLLPFPVFLAVVALIRFGPGGRSGRGGANSRRDA